VQINTDSCFSILTLLYYPLNVTMMIHFLNLAHIIDTSNAKTQLASSVDTTMQLLANEAHTPILFHYFENPNTIQLPLILTWLNHNEWYD